MRFLSLSATGLLGGFFMLSGCQTNVFQPKNVTPPAMSVVPAVRLNFRYEADVPAPAVEAVKTIEDDRNPAVQADFDANRPFELLDRTISSPDKKNVLAIYRHISDAIAEYRLDMYSPDGKMTRKVTSDTMAVHFPDTIVWSPDSTSLAFVAMIRAPQPQAVPSPAAISGLSGSSANARTQSPANSNTDTDVSDAEIETQTPQLAPTPAAPTGILTFRTEQIYICSADGAGARPITNTEGLIYFYYAWSPDSTMLVSLASTSREWQYLDFISQKKGEMMIPQGRPRIIEKNGRERRLDDNQTAVHPVWSPDSSKVAVAFDNQIRIYDTAGTNPTQAAIPLRNQLLISSQSYDREQQRKMQPPDANANPDVVGTAQPTPDQTLSTLPDEKLLVSYNPIVEIAWTMDDLLYLQTAYLKRMRNEADSVRSFSRWHRVVLSPQIVAPVK